MTALGWKLPLVMVSQVQPQKLMCTKLFLPDLASFPSISKPTCNLGIRKFKSDCSLTVFVLLHLAGQDRNYGTASPAAILFLRAVLIRIGADQSKRSHRGSRVPE